MTAPILVRILGIAVVGALTLSVAKADNETTIFLRSRFADNTKTPPAQKFITLSVQSTTANDGLIMRASAYDKTSPVVKIIIAKGSGAALQTCAIDQNVSAPPNVLLDNNGGAILDDAGGRLLADAVLAQMPTCEYTWMMPVSKPPINWYNDVTITATNAAGKSFTLPTKVVRPYGLPY